MDSRDKPGHDEKRVLFNLLESIENARRIFSQALVELRRNRIAVVATPSWQEARDAFDVRIELERLVVRQLAGKLTKAQITALNSRDLLDILAPYADEPERARVVKMPKVARVR